jgi:putative ABC transport system ATP-binding protein
MSLFEAQSICKYFREGSKEEVRALEGVSLTIEEGSFCILTGPSGSGKTTLLAVLGALERPSRGRLLFRGEDLTAASDVELARFRRRVGFIFQDFSLIPDLPVWENITYPLIPRAFRRRDRYALAQSLLAQIGMSEKIAVLPSELSGGEQQRVAVARALAGQPEVLLADEPTSNLDEAAGQALKSMLEEFHGQGKTVIVSSHEAQLLSLATSTYELQSGKLKERMKDEG